MANLIINNASGILTQTNKNCLVRFKRNKTHILILSANLNGMDLTSDHPPPLRLSAILRKDH